MDRLQAHLRHMGVNLRCGQITMPEQHLHHSQIRPMIEQMRGKRMAQCMGRQLRFNMRHFRIKLNSMPEGLSRHLFTASTWKQHI